MAEIQTRLRRLVSYLLNRVAPDRAERHQPGVLVGSAPDAGPVGRRNVAFAAVALVASARRDGPKQLQAPHEIGVATPLGWTTTACLVTDADHAVTETCGEVFIGMSGLTSNRTVTLPQAPATGMRLILKDCDGSVRTFDIIVDGNGANIDGDATYSMTSSRYQIRGSVTLYFNGSEWSVI